MLLHMGAGAVDSLVDAAVRNFDDYRDLGYEPGLATASVFAETGGITRDDILGALLHPQYAVASAGELRSHFPLLATSDDDPDLPAELARLQPAHFDVVLLAPPPSGDAGDRGGRGLPGGGDEATRRAG
jgi:hypothetical protein